MKHRSLSASNASSLDHDSNNSWLASKHESYLPLTPLPADNLKLCQAPLKQKRTMSLCECAHFQVASQQYLEGGVDVWAEQSVSQFGSEIPLLFRVLLGGENGEQAHT